MNLFLKNNSKKSSLTLRYGDGLNKAVQIPALGIKPAPIELLNDVKLLRSYTNVFKNLEIVRDEDLRPKNESPVKDENNDTTKQEENTEKDNQTENTNKPEENSDAGEQSGQENESTKEDDEQTSDDKDPEEGDANNSNNSEDSVDDKDPEEGDVNDSEKPVKYTKRQLQNMKPEKIEEIAKSLGIDVTAPETSSKKEQIAVILNKQEEEK